MTRTAAARGAFFGAAAPRGGLLDELDRDRGTKPARDVSIMTPDEGEAGPLVGAGLWLGLGEFG